MKINPIGIQSYEQVTNRERTPVSAEKAEQQIKSVDNKNININPQDINAGSKIAVKGTAGSYADYLSPEEKKAMDLLFARFQDTGRFGPGYKQGSEAQAEKYVGRIIDLKV